MSESVDRSGEFLTKGQMTQKAAGQRYTGFHIIIDSTGRDLDELHDALDALLCQRGHPDSDEPCAVELLASTTHADIDVVRKWVYGDE